MSVQKAIYYSKDKQTWQVTSFPRSTRLLINSLILFIVSDAVSTLEKMDHVYFVHPSTDISVDISTDSRPIYRLTYRQCVDRYVGRHIGQLSLDMSTDICRSRYRPMYRSICRPTLDRYVGQYVDREWLSDCPSTC